MSTQLFSVIEKEAIVFWGSENFMLTILHISSLIEWLEQFVWSSCIPQDHCYHLKKKKKKCVQKCPMRHGATVNLLIHKIFNSESHSERALETRIWNSESHSGRALVTKI